VKLLEVKSLAIPEVKVLRFGRFRDHRGYFTEHYRRSDLLAHPELSCFRDVEFLQANESFSRPGTVRGLHFQWNPYLGKLVRTVSGRMIDLVLDIRRGSPTVGKILAYDIPASPELDAAEWIWVPPGFAHGNFFPQETLIEYFCTGAYNPDCEAGISPLSADIDWSLCDKDLHRLFKELVAPGRQSLLSDKDRNGLSVAAWLADRRADAFVYSPA
jgi:dTDP-4-dehydrorhamnose 3,5-epimerase